MCRAADGELKQALNFKRQSSASPGLDGEDSSDKEEGI
jgi:hypothetical protein